jgi:hypothetical protein
MPRTVTDGTDTKINWSRPPGQRADHPIGAAAYLANLDRAADQIGGDARIGPAMSVTLCDRRRARTGTCGLVTQPVGSALHGP